MLVLLLSIAGCGPASSIYITQSDKPRLTSPDIGESETSIQANGNSTFAFDLYQVLRKDNDNFFYSPYSISAALAMTYAGARGDTASQMKETLRFLLPDDQLHKSFNSLDLELAKRGEGAKGKDDKGFRLNIVNAIWGQDGYHFQPEFLDILAENYGAGLRTLDFAGEAEKSRLTINDWVSGQTEGRIKDLLSPADVPPSTRLVLSVIAIPLEC